MQKTICALLLTIASTSQCISLDSAEERVKSMPLREKIGQLCVVASIIDEERDAAILHTWKTWQPLHTISIADVEKTIREEYVGGVVFFGRSARPQDLTARINHYQSISKIPLLITLDAEVGPGHRLDNAATPHFPTSMTLAATHDPALTYQMGREIGRQLGMLGVHVNFAPVVDINSNPKNPVIGMRAFGSDRETVAQFGIAYMQGLQDSGIIACAKHFPGHGDTSEDSHEELPLLLHSLKQLEERELYPFRQLIAAGVQSIMTAHLEIPALEEQKKLPASLSRAVVTDLLRQKMGFEGLIFTDALGMKGVASQFEPGEIELKALQAGNDILLCPLDAKRAIDRIEAAVYAGEIAEEEIDRKVLKLMRAKERLAPSQSCDTENLNNEATQTLRKTLFEKAMTLVKPGPILTGKTVVITTDPSLSTFEEHIKKMPFYSWALAYIANASPSEPAQITGDLIDLADHIVITLSKHSKEMFSSPESLAEWVHAFKAKGKLV
ncbi:MAG: glycoside hydrolase family 3 N-terminal domain-containing protein, partial [Chlamydiota bacterium]